MEKTLSSSQLEALEALGDHLAQNIPYLLLEGLPGTGKSTIAVKMQNQFPNINVQIIDVGAFESNHESNGDPNKLIILLKQAGKNLPENLKWLQQYPIVKIRALTREETQNILSSEINDVSQKNKIATYSLGVRSLIESICNQSPICELRAQLLCMLYLQGIIETCRLSGESRNRDLQSILQEYTDFPVPEEVLPRLSDCMQLDNISPQQILQSRLGLGLKKGDFPTPVTEKIFNNYQIWLQYYRDEPSFEVNASVTHDAYLDLLRKVGIHFRWANNPTFGNELLSGRKLFIRYLGRETVNTFNVQVSDLRTQSCEQGNNSNNLLEIYNCDHAFFSVLPSAYAIECALQKLGLPYTITLSGHAGPLAGSCLIFKYSPDLREYITSSPSNISQL